VLFSDVPDSIYLTNSDVVETVPFETETWSKFRDRDFIKNSETETRDLKFETETRDFKICAFCQIFLMCNHFWIDFFFKFLAIFRHVLVVFYLQIQQTQNRWIIEILLNYFFCNIFKVSRPETFETETRPETFETETRKNGSRDESPDRDQVSRLHHC